MCVDKTNGKPLVNPKSQSMSLLIIAINTPEVFSYWGKNKAVSASYCYCCHQLGLKAEGARLWKQGWVTSVSQSCKLYSNSNFLFLSLNIKIRKWDHQNNSKNGAVRKGLWELVMLSNSTISTLKVSCVTLLSLSLLAQQEMEGDVFSTQNWKH